MSDALHHNLIPQGTQVASKGQFRFCRGFGPKYAVSAAGAHVVCDDNRRYLDLVMGLGAVTLGHGLGFSRHVQSLPLPTRHEADLAALINKWMPHAEMMRFLKTGTDATTAAVRLARVHTGRSGICSFGNYHGWADWSLAWDKEGAPVEIRKLTTRYDRKAITDDQLAIYLSGYDRPAAVILEPISLDPIDMPWLKTLRDICTKNGIVLIFDEIITGFRYSKSGVAGTHNVIPDLVCAGKAMANGWPISVVAGKRDILQAWGRTHISGTHFSDPACMEAALSNLKTMDAARFWDHQDRLGQHFINGVRKSVKRHNLRDQCDIVGHPHWWCLRINDPAQQTLWQQECLRRNVLTIGSHFLSLAHKTEDIDTAIQVYDEALGILSTAIRDENVVRLLEGEINTTVFRRH